MKKNIIILAIHVLISSMLIAQTPVSPFEKEPYILFQNEQATTGSYLYTPELKDIVIMWQLTHTENCTFEWGVDDDLLYELGSVSVGYISGSDKQYKFAFAIDDLDPQTKYYYKVTAPTDVTDESVSIEGSFISPPLETVTNLTFYAYGDAQNDYAGIPSPRHNIACEKINELIGDNPSSQTLILNAGDWNHAAFEESWNDNYFNNAQLDVRELHAKLPVMGVYGNHDIWNIEPPAGPMVFEKYWPYSYVETAILNYAYNRYYSFDYGPMHVSCVHLAHHDWNLKPEQIAWLNYDLSNTDKKWKIVLLHAPGYSNGAHSLNQSVQNVLQPICKSYGVQLVISGHQHVYAHWLVQGVHHLTIDGVGRTYDIKPIPNLYNDIGELKAYIFNHFAEFNIEGDLMNIIVHHYDSSNWHNDFDSFAIPQSMNICDNQEISWDNDIIYADKIRVCSGSTLTISNESTIKFVEGGGIIVEAGGKLDINDSKLTTVHDDEMWFGIEVLGDPTSSSNPPDQGWVLVQDGSIIENSEHGIVASKLVEDMTDGDLIPDPAHAGGIIQATDSYFYNNQTAIQFYDYPSASVSWIRGCEFKVDDEYISTTLPENFVVIDNMITVDVMFSDFINATSTDYQFTGILSENSTIYVWGDCNNSSDPCDDWDEVTFENLEYGIYATATATTRYVDIRNGLFSLNKKGAYIGGMTNARVTSNIFEVDVPYVQNEENGYGLYLDESNGYWVEDNFFICPSGGNDPVGLGIIVNESGEDPNEIYLNEFKNIDHAINVQGENRNFTNTDIGLVIKCNEYLNTKKDETILWPGPRVTKTAGIAGLQGKDGSTLIEDMAGNLFHIPPGPPDGDFDDLDNQANPFNYYYSNNAGDAKVEPKDAQFNVTVFAIEVFTSPWSYATACEPTGSGGGGGGIGGIKGKMSAAQTEIETTEAILSALVDGGDTEGLNTEVETSSPPEAVQVYNELMAESPNLSETVVESTIEKETVLPNAMVRDVMVANPHTAKSLVLLDKLDDRFDPMPDYMKAQILAGRSIQTLKQELEGQLAGHTADKARAMNSIIRYYRDELEPEVASDSLLALYQSDNTIKSSYNLAWLYFERGEYLSGENVMDNIPNQYTLNENQQEQYTNMASVYNMLSGLYENGNTISSLTTSQLSELQTLAAEGAIPARAYARNILMSLGELDYEEPILFPDMFKSAQAIEEYKKLMAAEALKQLSVYPNPSTGYVILEYKLEMEAEAKIEVTDLNGRLLHTLSTQGTQDQVTLITEGWKPGVYIASLRLDGKTTESVKFTLVK